MAVVGSFAANLISVACIDLTGNAVFLIRSLCKAVATEAAAFNATNASAVAKVLAAIEKDCDKVQCTVLPTSTVL